MSGFDEYRAERIARTEMMFSYNAAATATYAELGVTHVVADDGDEDEECAARHGQVFSLDEAMTIEDHPNGTLDWLPVEPDIGTQGLRAELNAQRPIASMGGGATPVPPGMSVADALLGPMPTAAMPNALEVAAKQALAKLNSGVDITVDESTAISQAITAGHVTQDEFFASYSKLKQHQTGKKLLAKLEQGEDLSPVEEQTLNDLGVVGIITDDQYQAAANVGQLIKTKKQSAHQILESFAQGTDPGMAGHQALDQYVMEGIISQSQVEQAAISWKLSKQSKFIQAALDDMQAGVANEQQKQLVMDAITQGALKPEQQTQLAKIFQAQQQQAQTATALSQMTQHEQLQHAVTLMDQMKQGVPLNPAAQGQMDWLLQQKVISDYSYQQALKALKQEQAKQIMAKLDAAKMGDSNALTPDEWNLSSQLVNEGYLTTTQVNTAFYADPVKLSATKKRTSKLKGPGGANAPDTFDAASFNPKPYATREAHDKALHGWQSRVNSSLSHEAKEAMRSYTNSGYTEMNGVLRGASDYITHYTPDEIRRVKREVELVRESMHPTTQDVIVKRGTTTHMFGPGGNNQIGLDEVMRMVQPGSEWIDNGFMSTSINRGHSWSGDILLELKVPKGTPAAYAQAISSHKSEYEILLDAGTRIVIESIDQSYQGGQIRIVAHVKPR